MSKFIIVAGIHCQGGKTFHKGETVSSDRPLDTLFPGKFSKVPEPVHVKSKASSPTPPPPPPPEDEDDDEDDTPPAKSKASAKDDDEDDEDEGVKSDLGTDVTGDFPDAKEADYVVLQDGKKFHVVEPANPNKSLNKKPLSAKQVSELIADLTK